MGNCTDWPKRATMWVKNRTLHISIPFTWNLPEVRNYIERPNLFWDTVIVGGPALNLMSNYFEGLPYVSWRGHCEGVLQRVNPMATKTTIGCVNACGFCAVPRIEGGFVELEHWPDLPIICDNNLLASSQSHFDRVIDRLVKWGWTDFNQGLDCRLLTDYHAQRIAQIKKPMIRLALDSGKDADKWERALETLLKAGIAKRHIRSYALIGFRAGPEEAWHRCMWIESHKIKVLPMWFHPLDVLEKNRVTEQQESLGWTDAHRKRIMQYFYQHRGTPGPDAKHDLSARHRKKAASEGL